MPTGFYIWLVVFIIIVIGTITKPLWDTPVTPKKEESPNIERAKNVVSVIIQLRKELETTNNIEYAETLLDNIRDCVYEFYRLGHQFEGLPTPEDKMYFINKAYESTCKRIERMEKIKDKVQITEQYFEQLVKYSNEDINKYTFQESENDLLVWIDNLYLKTLEQKLNEVISLINQNNEKGKELEEQGNFKEAATFYEKNLTIDYSDKLCIDRLLIVYRKLKDYENEKRICEIAIQKYSAKKYKDRLLTIEDKITKASKP